MLIATFGPTTAWAGKTITFENQQFILEGHGATPAADIMEYDRQGRLVWTTEEARSWVGEVARAPRTHGEPAGQTVCIGKAKYLEGSPYDGWPWSGLVTVSTECIEVQGRPSVPLSSISSVRLDSQQIARETIVGTSLLGVGQKLTFLTKRGELLTFQLEEQSELEVRAALTPILRLAGVPFHEELTQTPSPNAQPGGSGGASARSIGDEIERLAELHAKGTLTDEEFAALKAKVMG